MDHEREKRFMVLIRGLADILGKEVSNEMLKVYYLSIKDLSVEALQSAVIGYLKTNKPFFPTPGQLLAILEPSPDERAREAAALILSAVSKIGNYRVDDAKDYIGELGWEVVKRQGGWEEICKSLTDDNKSTYQAQWRELAVSLINKNRLGILDQRPTLAFKNDPGASNLQQLLPNLVPPKQTQGQAG